MQAILRKPKEYFKRFRLVATTFGFSVKGPLGTASYHYPLHKFGLVCQPDRKEGVGWFSPSSLFLDWLDTMHRGVTVGYFTELTLSGVAFKGQFLKYSRALSLDLGYSHTICFLIPVHAKAFFDKRRLVIFSSDKQWLSSAARKIKELRWPDAYRGKGIIYKNEKLKLKPGKQRQ